MKNYFVPVKLIKNNVLNIFDYRLLFFICFFVYTNQSIGQATQVKQVISNNLSSKQNPQRSYHKKNTSEHKEVDVTRTQESSLPSNSIYFVNNKAISREELKEITKDAIVSINVIKKDTVVNGVKFDSQIFVITN